MGDWTILAVDEVPDPSGDDPGEVRFMTAQLDGDQLAFSYRRLAPQSGGIPTLPEAGHSHSSQEEIYFVISGTVQLKLDDEVVEAGPRTAVRMSPDVVRSVWNQGPDEAELIMFSTKVEDLRAEANLVQGFWPEH